MTDLMDSMYVKLFSVGAWVRIALQMDDAFGKCTKAGSFVLLVEVTLRYLRELVSGHIACLFWGIGNPNPKSPLEVS